MPSNNRYRHHSQEGNIFFHSLLKHWEQALDPKQSPVTIDLELCGFHLRLNFTSRTLADHLTRAFDHCPTPPESSQPDYTIFTLVGPPESTLPKLPWQREDLEFPRGEIRPILGPDIMASYLDTRILNIHHRKRREGIFWLRHESRIPNHEQAAPFRILLHWWLRENGWIMVHGGGIGINGQGLLIMGKGGSGKSTLSVAAACKKGLQFLGDDYCVLKTTPPFRIAPVYSTAKLSSTSCRLLGFPPSPLLIEGSEKNVYFLSDKLSLKNLTSLPLHALVLPSHETGKKNTDIKPLSKAQTAIHLSVSSIYQLPHAGETEFKKLAATARSLPGWLLTVPDNAPAMAVPVLRKIIESSREIPPDAPASNTSE